jgi:dsDNA-specific endonuclease/ATPase MutS2
MKENKGQKKVVNRTAAIAVAIICIILAASLVSVIAVYLPMVNNLNSQITEKNTEIADLNSEISALNSQVSSLQASVAQNAVTIQQLNSTVQNLRGLTDVLDAQIEDNLNIIYLNASGYLLEPTTLTQDANSSTILGLYADQLEYTGVVIVDAQSTSNTTYAQVIYNSYGVNYNQNITVGTSGTAYFPVLPGGIAVQIGNTEPAGSDPVGSTVSVVYLY